MKHFLLILSFIIGFSTLSFSQKQVRKDIREGNKEYKQEKYTDAEVDYRRALEANARSIEAAYNLGNTLYRQGKLQEALEQYQVVANNKESDKAKLSMAWHNTGNIMMAAKDYGKSIDAYKMALRNNPKDDETRYNLALAQKLLENQQDQNQDQKQDQNKDQKQQDQQQKQDQQDQQQQEQQQNPNEMSKQNADQILDAMMQEEKNTQEKVKMEQVKQQKQKKTDKNW